MRLLIVGATGLVGSLALNQALADPRVSCVVALTRRPVPTHDKLENVIIDFAAMPAEAAWWAVDGVVCALGTTRAVTRSSSEYRAIDHDYPLEIARHTCAHGATRFALTSSLGATSRSRFVYTRQKGELEASLKTLDFTSLTIVRPSVLGGHREERRFGEGLAQTLFGAIGPLLPRDWRVSPADAVAATLLDGAIEGPPGISIKTNTKMRFAA